MQEAMFYKSLGDKEVRCTLCPHYCKIANFKRGICGVRENREGVLYTLVYGKAISWAIDPIEKKTPLPFLSWFQRFLFSYCRMQYALSPLSK